MKARIHRISFEKFILEVHVILFLCQFVHLVKLVHVQLPYKRRQMTMPEKMREHFLLQFLTVPDQNLAFAVPTNIFLVFFALRI